MKKHHWYEDQERKQGGLLDAPNKAARKRKELSSLTSHNTQKCDDANSRSETRVRAKINTPELRSS